MIDYKYFLYGAIGIGFLMDIFEKGLMSVGIILGWLIGMMTITQWQIQKENKSSNVQKANNKEDSE